MVDLKRLRQEALEQDRREEEARERREAAFRAKVAVQQFMNHNGPIFSAFARVGIPVTDVVEGEVLRRPVTQAARLATLVAAKVMRKDPSEVSAADARFFRAAAASYVAHRWLSRVDMDVERAAEEIARAAALADGSWDHDPYRDEGLSDNASLMITAVNAVATLARAVEKYDFRAGREAVLRRLTETIVSAAASTGRELLGEEASEADVRNVTQTVARNLSSILEACYERKAREVVALLANKTEAEKRAWYERHDPVGEVLDAFREWTLCFGAFAVAASRDMAHPRQSQAVLPERAPAE